ncbi:MAG: TIGR04255 family protein [Candidatus Eisenbacteria bacterium]|nr:TIGR04255 family protein [Candidatus Eisenbacteria bacterium]
MNEVDSKLAQAPIVEAIVEIYCDVPPGLDLASVARTAAKRFESRYPKGRTRLLEQHTLTKQANVPPEYRERLGVHAYLFSTEDELQTVQVRGLGFSFNRLAPYGSLDEYLPDIEWAWGGYKSIVMPLLVREVRLRYVNRILIPKTQATIDLARYITLSPGVPGSGDFTLSGFLTQYIATENATGSRVSVTATPQAAEEGHLPVILDIQVSRVVAAEPDDWESLAHAIASLRVTKNRVFRGALTPDCMELFQ